MRQTRPRRPNIVAQIGGVDPSTGQLLNAERHGQGTAIVPLDLRQMPLAGHAEQFGEIAQAQLHLGT